jgi:hypothetical protein
MNVFFLDSDPEQAARDLCDKHVVKMTTESAQILCTSLSALGISGSPYRSTHSAHPCVKWAKESSTNFEWLLLHAFEQAEEYARRYGKFHGALHAICFASENFERAKFPSRNFSRPALAMPEEFRTVSADPVDCYRAYYYSAKRHFARWKSPSQPPKWWL